MRWPVALLLFCGLLATGCQSPCDLVESELRAREHDVCDLKAEVSRLHADNDSLQRELQAVRVSGSAKITPELASQTYTLKAITLARQTGGYDSDGLPGDEALQVVLEPRDPDGQAIKAPGSVEVLALEISPEGIKRPLCSWHVDPEQLRRSWRSGLLTTAYFLVLPWKNWPTCERLRVVAQFTLSDGRVFEADKDVTVHLPPTDSHTPVPDDLRPPGTPAGPPLEPLPPPRKLVTPPAAAAVLWQSAKVSATAAAVQVMRPIPIR